MPELMDPMAAAFRLEGDNGEAVALIHGFTGVPSHFRPLAGKLNEAGYTVTVPRLAGHGTSPEDLATTTASDWIASAEAAVDRLAGHDRVHLVGISMGGLIAMVLAGRVGAASVTIINSPLIVRNKTLYAAPLSRPFIKKVEWPEPDFGHLDEEMRPYWLPYSGFYTKSAGGLLAILLRASWAARGLDVPSLIIQSRNDESVSPRSARIWRRLLGGDSQLIWLENSLHNALLDKERDQIAAAVLARLEA